MGMTDRDPDSEQLAKMVDLVRQGMRAGAFGLSSGLYYAPGSYSKTGEVVAMARMAAQFGGVYSSHIRDEADYTIGVVAAVQEVITIAEQAGLIGVVSHMKALGPASHGLSMALDRAHRGRTGARRAGVLRSVSVQRQRHRHRRRADSALGAGGRPRRAAQTHPRRRARKDARGGARQHRPTRRRRHAGHQPLRARSVDRRPASRRARAEGRQRRPRSMRSTCSSAATRASCRSTCPSATSSSSCGSRGP